MRRWIFNSVKRMLLDKKYTWIIKQAYKWGVIKLASTFNLLPITGPLFGSIAVTYKCNSAGCKMCNLWERATLDKRMELTTEECFSLIDEFKKLGISGISFTGGEPLLRDDIYKLIYYARKKDMMVNICTNGLLLTNKEAVQKLIDSNLHNINISLDSANESSYDCLRGAKGEFRSTIEGIKNIVTYKRQKRLQSPQITVVTVLSKRNLHELDSIISLCENIGVENIGFMPVHKTFEDGPSGVWDDLCFKTRDDDIEKAVDKLIRWQKRKNGIQIDNTARYIQMFPLAFSGSPSPVRCISGYGSIAVDVYGDVYPCWFLLEKGKAVNNIRSSSLINIWRSKEYQSLRSSLCYCRDCFWNCQAELNLGFDLFGKINNAATLE